ncbi:MAG: hypothetical protein AAGN64_11455, partial [Bacteroidota bacterium]
RARRRAPRGRTVPRRPRAVDLGVVAPQQAIDVAVPTGGLAPGLYVLRAEGPSITASRRVVVR